MVISVIIEQEILDVFLDEYNDMLMILDQEIKKYPNANIAINEIFRVFHTLKGNSATIEYIRLSNLTKFYCEYFRMKQNETKLSDKEFNALRRCYDTLLLFKSRIKKGKKGQTIKIKPIMTMLQ